MKQFFSPNEIDYRPLIEFLNEVEDTFKDELPLDADVHFAARFEQVDNRTEVEIIQYGEQCMSFSIKLTLDGDFYVINSFLRAFNAYIIRYSPSQSIAKKLKEIPIELIPYEYDSIQKEAIKFRQRLTTLFNRAQKLYKEKQSYYDHIENALYTEKFL